MIAGSTKWGDFLIWDIDNLNLVLHHQTNGYETSYLHRYVIAWAPDSNQIAVGDYLSIKIYKLHDRGWEIIQEIDSPGNTLDMEWSPNGDILVIAGGEGAVDFLDTNSWKILYTYDNLPKTNSSDSYIEIDWSPDGRKMLVGYVDYVIRMLELNFEK